MEAIRLAIVDDHAFFLEAFSDYIARFPGISVVFTTSDSTAVIRLVRQNSPQLLLLDRSMPERSSVSVLDALYEARISLPVLIFSVSFNQQTDGELLHQENVVGYLLKGDDPGQIIAAISRAAQGGRDIYSQEILEALSQEDPEEKKWNRLAPAG